MIFKSHLRALSVIAAIFWGLTADAQHNLVPNPSFEEKDSCPSILYELTPTCLYWFDPISKMVPLPPIAYNVYDWGIASYFNSCNHGQVGVPSNLAGIQDPRTGEAYAGFNVITHYISPPIYDRFFSYIEVELSEALKKNYTYLGEFYYSHAELYSNPDPNFFSNTLFFVELGMLFTDSIMIPGQGGASGQPLNFYNKPQVTGMMGPVVDTTNWIKVSGTFVAKGGEKFLTIGTFEQVDSITKDAFTHIYIEDVKVIAIDSFLPGMQIIVYPNPARDIVWIEATDGSLDQCTLIIHDICGRKVMTIDLGSEGETKREINLHDLGAGTYIYEVFRGSSKLSTGKLILY